MRVEFRPTIVEAKVFIDRGLEAGIVDADGLDSVIETAVFTPVAKISEGNDPVGAKLYVEFMSRAAPVVGFE